MNDVTLLITACDRVDLLEKTLVSFVKFNTYPIKELVIRDDCGLPKIHQDTLFLLDRLRLPFPYRMLPCMQVGQGKSIDLLMQEVHTPYVFHSEEDWEFYKSGFIEKSMEIMEENEKISHVWIRPPEGIAYPEWTTTDYFTKKNKIPYQLVKRTKHTNAWSFNPHLARMCDYHKPYMQIVEEAPLGEDAIGVYYKKLGYETGWLIEGYVRHIGYDKSTYRPGTPYREKAKKL